MRLLWVSTSFCYHFVSRRLSHTRFCHFKEPHLKRKLWDTNATKIYISRRTLAGASQHPRIDLTPSLHHSPSPSCSFYVPLFSLPIWTSLSFSSPSCPVIPPSLLPPPPCACRVWTTIRIQSERGRPLRKVCVRQSWWVIFTTVSNIVTLTLEMC